MYRQKGRDVTANSGADITANELLCFFAQVSLLISCWTYVWLTPQPLFLSSLPSLFSFLVFFFSSNSCVLIFCLWKRKKKKKKRKWLGQGWGDGLLGTALPLDLDSFIFLKAEDLIDHHCISLVAWDSVYIYIGLLLASQMIQSQGFPILKLPFCWLSFLLNQSQGRCTGCWFPMVRIMAAPYLIANGQEHSFFF